MSKARVCTVVATPLTIQTFLQKQLQVLGMRYDLSVVCNSSDPELLRNLAIEGTLRPVGIERRIRPHADLAALIRIVRLFRRERFDLVHSVTPKAGLVAMLGSFLAGCPRRVHTFTGQVWVTRSGVTWSGKTWPYRMQSLIWVWIDGFRCWVNALTFQH